MKYTLLVFALLIAGCGGYEEKNVLECYESNGRTICSEETKYFGEAGK